MQRRSNLLTLGIPILLVTVVLVVLIASAGAGDRAVPDDSTASDGNEFDVAPVTIETIDVRLAESYPVQVFVDVHGYVPDPCWEPQEPVIEEDGNRIEVEILAERDVAEMCIQAIEDYETTLSLGPRDPGEYVISVNGVEQEFEVH